MVKPAQLVCLNSQEIVMHFCMGSQPRRGLQP